MTQSLATINSLKKNTQVRQKNGGAKKIGVCLLLTDIDAPAGGVQNISFHLLNELTERGNKTFACTRNYYHHQRNERRNGILIHRSLTFNRAFTIFNSLSYLIDGLVWLVRHRKEYDVIHCQQIFAPAMLGFMARKILRKPVLVGVHSTGKQGEINELRNSPLRKLRLRQLFNVDSWAVLNQEMREDLVKLGIAPEKIKFIPNATVIPDDAAYLPEVKNFYRAKLNLPYQQVVTFSGRLTTGKGLDTLMRAWAIVHEQNPQAHLLILGKGGLPDVESETRALCDELKLNATVHFVGFKPNPMEYLLASDVFVLPTLTEGMSLALIEAIAAGTAIVTTNIPANLYLCQDSVNSLLVSPNDPHQLAEAMIRVLSDPKLQEQLGRKAQEKACQDLSLEVMTDRYLDLYTELIENKAFT